MRRNSRSSLFQHFRYYLLGAVVSGIALISLLGVKRFERKISKDWFKEMTIVSEDVEGQIDRVEELIDKYNMKVTNLNIGRNLQNKEITLEFRLRFRAVQPGRNILKEVINLTGIKRVSLE